MSDGPWGAAFDFIDRFLNNYAIWLWLLVFFCLLWVSVWMGYISHPASLTDFDYTSRISALLVFCLFMNAINAHVHIFSFCREVAGILLYLSIWTYRKLTRSKSRAKQAFRAIMSSNCRERVWLIWFLFEWEPSNKYKNFTLVRSRVDLDNISKFQMFVLYNSHSAYILLSQYHIFFTLSGREYIWDRVESEYSLDMYQEINLFSELEHLLNHNAGLRSEIRLLAESVKGKTMKDLNRIEHGLDWYSNIIKTGPDQVEYDRRRNLFVEKGNQL